MLILSSFLTNKTIVNSCRCEKLHKREQNHKIVEDRSPTSSHADQERLSRCLVPGYLAGYSRTQGTLLPIKFFTHITMLSQMRPDARLPSFQSSFQSLLLDVSIQICIFIDSLQVYTYPLLIATLTQSETELKKNYKSTFKNSLLRFNKH